LLRWEKEANRRQDSGQILGVRNFLVEGGRDKDTDICGGEFRITVLGSCSFLRR